MLNFPYLYIDWFKIDQHSHFLSNYVFFKELGNILILLFVMFQSSFVNSWWCRPYATWHFFFKSNQTDPPDFLATQHFFSLIMVIFQDQMIYEHTLFRGAKWCNVGGKSPGYKKGMFLDLFTNSLYWYSVLVHHNINMQMKKQHDVYLRSSFIPG